MRIVTNQELIRKNRRTATWLFFFSMAILIFGFFVANGQVFGLVPEEDVFTVYTIVTPIVLLIGFVTTLTSVRMTNLWVRIPRPEIVIPEGLKGIQGRNKTSLYNYYHLPVRHVLITQQGIFPIVTRFQDGRFTVTGDKWKSHKGFFSTIFSFLRLDGIGNPNQDVEIARNYIKHLVEDYDSTIPIYPVVVFFDPRAEVEINDPTIPVVYADNKRTPNLKDYVQSFGNEPIEQFKGEELQNFITEWEASTLD
jgi:hypothetical protein